MEHGRNLAALVHAWSRLSAQLSALLPAGVAPRLANDLLPWPVDLPPPDPPLTLQETADAWPRWLASDAAPVRKQQGSWYTPPALCAVLADLTRPVAATEPAWVVDPACGDGRFLWAAADVQLAAGLPVAAVLGRLCGIDRDPGAVLLARARLWLWQSAAGCVDVAAIRRQLVWGDALAPLAANAASPQVLPAAEDTGPPAIAVRPWLAGLGAVHGADVILGNPPYLSQLRSRTTRDRDAAASLAATTDGELRGYADTAAAFWALSRRWLAPGGAVCLLTPRSLLSSRDAAAVRAGLAGQLHLQAVWRDDRPLFDAAVRTVALVLADRPPPDAVPVLEGLPPRAVANLPAPVPADGWTTALLDRRDHAIALPFLLLDGHAGLLGDLAQVTADFRDEYYGLQPAVRESTQDQVDGPQILTSGLLDVLSQAWGQRPCRLHGQRWQRPVLEVTALDPALQRWWHKRAVPKVLVATQTAVLEAVADPTGQLVPVTPLLSVLPHDPADVWRLAAALTAPLLTRLALQRHAGAGLSTTALKLSARQLAALPLPTDNAAWQEAALLAAQLAEAPVQARDLALDRLVVLLGRACGQSAAEARLAADWWWSRRGLSVPNTL